MGNAIIKSLLVSAVVVTAVVSSANAEDWSRIVRNGNVINYEVKDSTDHSKGSIVVNGDGSIGLVRGTYNDRVDTGAFNVNGGNYSNVNIDKRNGNVTAVSGQNAALESYYRNYNNHYYKPREQYRNVTTDDYIRDAAINGAKAGAYGAQAGAYGAQAGVYGAQAGAYGAMAGAKGGVAGAAGALNGLKAAGLIE